MEVRKAKSWKGTKEIRMNARRHLPCSTWHVSTSEGILGEGAKNEGRKNKI